MNVLCWIAQPVRHKIKNRARQCSCARGYKYARCDMREGRSKAVSAGGTQGENRHTTTQNKETPQTNECAAHP
jgi:hypothetical protein